MSTSMKKENIPGLTIHVKEKELTPCSGKAFKSTGFITLRAEVNDFDIWDQVVDRLDGMTVYTVNDLTGAVIQAAQRRANRAEAMAMNTMEEARQRVDELEARTSFLEADNNNLNHQLVAVLKERDELQELVDTQEQAIDLLRGGYSS